LLCCGYKLISGVVASRLEKYLGKLIGRAQKGFIRSKSMNTCTINIIDRIAGAWKNRDKSGVLCVDFVKAFDSIEHIFIKRVMRFFNFGHKMVGMVSTLLNNRLARVIVNNEYSDSFEIGRGSPQGDRSSPFVFILCIEILLIKIKGMAPEEIRNVSTLGGWCRLNNMGEEGTSEGFADDITILFDMFEGSLRNIIRTLDGFYGTSGLQLNKNKTQLMVVGCDEYVIGEMIDGITIVGEIKVLGLYIDRKLEALDRNWMDAIRKISKIANFWKLQRLNISGRILVAKTFMLSQVTFYMGTLPLRFEIGEQLNSIMANYVKGTDRLIAKNRWCLDRELGGYGLIDVHLMNTCVKATWISKWIINTESIDINGYRTGVSFDKPVDQWGVNERIRESDPLTFGILTEWKNYKRMFYRCAGNIWQARMFENDGILEGVVNIGTEIFGRERYLQLTDVAKKVRVGDIMDMEGVKAKEAAEARLGMRLNMAEYFRMRNMCHRIRNVFGGMIGEGKCLDSIMRTKKRGGGALRRYLGGKCSPTYVDNDPRRLAASTSFWGNDVVHESRSIVEMNYGLWGLGKLGAGFKMFLFNMLQGKLYLNNVLVHIGAESNKCTFCTIKGKQELRERGIGNERPEYQYYLNLLPVENINHIFWECEHVSRCIQECYRWIRGFDWYRGNETMARKEFFLGRERENVGKNLVLCDILWKHFVKYFIYNCRSQRKLPMFPSLKFELEGLFSGYKMLELRTLLLRLNELYD